MTFGSLFAGIGGLDLGLERAGMQCKWQVEIDPYATKVLEKHWPTVRRWRDVRKWIATDKRANSAKYRRRARWQRRIASLDEMRRTSWSVDLICGGFPCQPVSVAGQRRGDADDRWMWPHFIRVVRVIRPRWVLAENVPGLLSADSGRLFGGILRDLAEAGYDAEWTVLPAAAFGAPHIRDRVFVVANAEKQRSERTELFGIGNQQFQRSRNSGWWATEPDVGRVAHGVPSRVDRLRCLGNAVVPQVAEWIGRRIMEHLFWPMEG